jgi:hypothetical protein
MKKLQEDQWTKSMNHTVESEPSAPPAADKQVVCDEPAKPALQPVRKRGCTLVLQPEAICRKTDLLSVVWKSRNSSRGLYRCPRRSAHDRRPANAMRFLMKTLRQRPSPALIPAFRQNLPWLRSGCPGVFVLPAKSGYAFRGSIALVGATSH